MASVRASYGLAFFGTAFDSESYRSLNEAYLSGRALVTSRQPSRQRWGGYYWTDLWATEWVSAGHLSGATYQ